MLSAEHPLGITCTEADIAALPQPRHDCHGEWNCSFLPERHAST